MEAKVITGKIRAKNTCMICTEKKKNPLLVAKQKDMYITIAPEPTNQLGSKNRVGKVWVEKKVSFFLAARMLEICEFNNIAQRLILVRI